MGGEDIGLSTLAVRWGSVVFANQLRAVCGILTYFVLTYSGLHKIVSYIFKVSPFSGREA